MEPLHNVAIIGMGLIGGSIAKALKKNSSEITIASLKHDSADVKSAMTKKALDILFDSWEELIAWSDLIILATPLSALASLAKEIAKRCPQEKKLVVIDVGSVKKAVFPIFETLTTQNLDFLSTHPMAGKENWGFENSEADLFKGCCWILSLHEKNEKGNIASISNLIEMMGAQTLEIDPKTHDEHVALVSHLPALLSRLYLKFVEQTNPDSLKVAGPGFKSMTRLAKDNPQMQSEITDLNSEEILKQLKLFMKFIEKEAVS